MAKETFKLGAVNAAGVIADERLYLTSDRKTVVKEGDKGAAFLFAAVGQTIPIKMAQQYGLVPLPEAKAHDVKGVEPEARHTRPAEPTHKR